MSVLDLPCATCGAQPGQRCTDTSGRPSLFVHRARRTPPAPQENQ